MLAQKEEYAHAHHMYVPQTTSTLTTEAKAECNSTNPQLRNGVCELRYNSMQCGWDAGDCCKISAGNYDPQNCIDPQQTNSCETMPPNENAVDSNSCLGSPANTKCSFACIPGHAVSESDSELICNGATGTWETLSGSIPSIICRSASVCFCDFLTCLALFIFVNMLCLSSDPVHIPTECQFI